MKSREYVRAHNRLRRAIKRAYRELDRPGGWRTVGADFGVTGGMAYRIAKEGYQPSDAQICAILGLPITVEVELNPKTGRLHIPAEIKVVRMRAPKKRLDEMSDDEIRWALEHREELRS